MSEFNQRLVFGDPNAIALIKRKQKKDLRKMKITISYDKLVQVGLSEFQAEDLIQRLVNYKRKK